MVLIKGRLALVILLAYGLIGFALASGIRAGRARAQEPISKHAETQDHNVPTEGKKIAQTAYVIEPPDLLTVELLKALPDQPLTGERLVRTDGTVNLGFYGHVVVAGLTIDQARERVEQHLSTFVRNPKVNLDVYSYNSKGYYVIAEGARGDNQTVRLPFTGNETVLDAISQIGGLPPVSDKGRIWLARPGQGVMPIKWNAIVKDGDPATNYQMQPNDRIYIATSAELMEKREPMEASTTPRGDVGWTVTAVNGRIHVAGSGFSAYADSVRATGQPEQLLLEGNVRLSYDKDGTQMKVSADRFALGQVGGAIQFTLSNTKAAESVEKKLMPVPIR
jgi:protein involved in polysaccharide export with SLBB domain